MTQVPKKKHGTVYLVGAGPGDPGLITARGLELLQRADVVVFDALANPVLLGQTRDDAILIDVGKRSNNHKLNQDQINELLVDRATKHRLVVRLKGGDPYLFGRGGEEAIFLEAHGVNCQVVPGVTSGIAAPAAAGIPVTHRNLSSSLTLVTGHEDPTKAEASVDYRSLSGLIKGGGTVCMYMAMSRLQQIASELRNHGVSAETPAAVIQWGTLPKQRSIRATLEDVAEAAEREGLGAPAILVIGRVAGVSDPGLEYFTNRPLFGVRVVVTRTRHQASGLRVLLEESGADVLEAPTIELTPPRDWARVDRAIESMNGYDWLVLTSSNGVSALRERLDDLNLDARHLTGLKIAAIGKATADALREKLGIGADLVPTRFVAESLAGELIAREGVGGKRLLLLRADIARAALPRLLAEAGAEVDDLVVYETRVPEGLPEEVLAAFEHDRVDWVTFTSSSTARNLVELLGDRASWLRGVRTASIGPITSEALRELGFEPDVEASQSDIGGLVEAMRSAIPMAKT